MPVFVVSVRVYQVPSTDVLTFSGLHFEDNAKEFSSKKEYIELSPSTFLLDSSYVYIYGLA